MNPLGRWRAVAVAGALVVAGCGSSPGGSDVPDRPAPTTSVAGPQPQPSDDPTLPPSESAVVLRGTVTRDDDRCLTLVASGDNQAWLLVGSTAGIEAGAVVAVRGSPAPDLATRCQRGTPFVVEAVEPG